jgi:hypothetical protein
MKRFMPVGLAVPMLGRVLMAAAAIERRHDVLEAR